MEDLVEFQFEVHDYQTCYNAAYIFALSKDMSVEAAEDFAQDFVLSKPSGSLSKDIAEFYKTLFSGLQKHQLSLIH